MARTPPFLRWALNHACPFRDPARETDLEQIGRQLLVLRACGDAFAEERVFEEIAFARDVAFARDIADVDPGTPARDKAGDRSAGASLPPPRGFRIAEVFAAYGGRERIEAHCPGCPVNVSRAALAPAVPTWGGCCGLVEWSAWGEPAAWDALIDTLLEEIAPADRWRPLFLPTRPAWPGLWAAGPLTSARLELLEPLLARLAALPPLAAAFRDLAAAAQLSRRTGVALRVQLYPGGDVLGRRWLVDAYCSRCGSSRPEGSRSCPVCGWDAQAVPARSRGAYGGRPYWPLEQMLGRDPAAALVTRYRQRRVHYEGR